MAHETQCDLREISCKESGRLFIGHMHDQGMVNRTAFGGKDKGHRAVIVTATGQAVNGLCGYGHHVALRQPLYRMR
jgi:hypothetical protein